jgi:type III restriction enzyme
MLLKNYQKNALKSLERFIELLGEKNSLSAAYNTLWEEQGVVISAAKGLKGFPPYQNIVKNVPHVCIKIPTGGGKTFVAVSAVKTIFDGLQNAPTKSRFVVWLVPSTAILVQTARNLRNVEHDYRKRLNADFSGGVSVLEKTELLNATNFSPSTVENNLTVCVLSYDSLRTKSKDGRLVYRENGNLINFGEDVSLFDVIRRQNPIVVVDESHNATSALSVDMLASLQPSFILDLTATPKETSNIIHITPAAELKKANMVKLPVVVYRRPDKDSVVSSAINLRNSLEKIAENEDSYIRPIVLFQAQPKTSTDSETFDKLKKELIAAKIPEEEIAIKISNKDELSKIDLLSPDCKVRYIITVNALKEGWDCPFAYILATVANKTSTVDVEQIVGRVLRLPNAVQPKNKLLANSYVFSCSNDFRATLDKIVTGLNGAGFSNKDVRVQGEEEAENLPTLPTVSQTTANLSQFAPTAEQPENTSEQLQENDDVFLNAEAIISATSTPENPDTANIIIEAEQAAEQYEKAATTENEEVAPEVKTAMNVYEINAEFREIAESLKLPQFVREGGATLFEDPSVELIDKRELSKGFNLAQQDAVINFSAVSAEAYRVDISDSADSPVTSKLATKESEQLKRYFAELSHNTDKKKVCIGLIAGQLDMDRVLGGLITREDIAKYLDNVFSSFDDDRFAAVQADIIGYKNKIKEKIELLLTKYRKQEFENSLAINDIRCEPFYTFPPSVSPSKISTPLQKSLYVREGDMNDFEWKAISEIAAFENVVFWHRILDRNGFCLNGFINHYPDFVMYTQKGNIVLVETKGGDRDNTDSINKLALGTTYASGAGNKYKYFMVFDSNPIKGAYTLEDFLSLVGKL